MDRVDIAKTYAHFAPAFDEDIVRTAGPIEESIVLSLVPPAARDVLDAATGTGRYALSLARTGMNVSAIDICPEMLARAMEKAAKENLSVTFLQSSLEAIPMPDESVDAVVCAMALAHVPDLVNAVRELFRVLRKGGTFVMSDLHPNIQRQWGPDYIAFVKEGRLLIDGHAKEGENPQDVFQVPFPQYRKDVSEYLDAVTRAHGEVISAVEVCCRQMLGLLPLYEVVLATKLNPELSTSSAAQA